MAKQSVLNRPHVSEHTGRYAHELGRELNYNQSAGMLLPRFVQYCVKGTKGRINRMAFTRTASVVTPAFDRVTQHLDFFKVPIRLLYSVFNDWSLDINDVNSSALLGYVSLNDPNQLPVQLPSADFSGILQKIYDPTMFPSSSFATETARSNAIAKAYNDALRLIDSLDYGQQCDQSTGSNVLSLLPLAAYQKVYFDHYRNTSYESNNAYLYNLDWTMNSPQVDLTDIASITNLNRMFTLRYVNYRNDFFHNLYPSLNYVASSPNGLNGIFPSDVVGVTKGTNSVLRQAFGTTYRPSLAAIDNTNTSLNSYNNVQGIRSLFALDKLLRASAYAPKHVREQFKARFGVDPGNKVSFESERLGSFVNNVTFGEVTATSTFSTSGMLTTYLGDIGGKGVGSSSPSPDLEFYCEEDCIIIGINYFMPKGFYDSLGVSEFNTYLVKDDFPQPETQNLGLRPLYSKSLYNTGTQIQRNQILGYTVPYQGDKLGIDKNYGLFNRQRVYYQGVVTSGTADFPQAIFTNGSLQTFATHVSQLSDSVSAPPALTYASFKVVPNDMDTIFRIKYRADGNELADQFYGWLKIKCDVVNWLSLHGQPSL